MIKTSIISLIIRGFSILSRFALVVFLGKFLPTSEYGVYGLLQSSLAVGVYLIGLDLYVYTNRELPKKNIAGARSVVISQFAVHFIAYLIFIPLTFPLLSNKFIPSQYILWFFVLLLLEHITFEIVRILIALQHPLYANTLILSRSIVWVAAFLAACYINPAFLSILNLLIFWVCGLALALIVGIRLLYKVKILPFNEWKIDFFFC